MVSTAVLSPLKLKSRSPDFSIWVSIGRGRRKRPACPLVASFASAGPAGVAQAHEFRALVEGFAGRIVERFSQQFVVAHAGDAHQLRVPPRNQQRDEGEVGRRAGEQGRQQVGLQVVQADRGNAERIGQTVGDRRAHEQRAGEPGALGIGDSG